MGRFFTVNRSTKYIFWTRNAFYDTSCIIIIVSYGFFYLMVYDKCTFEKKKVFSTFYTHTHFYEIRVTTKNLDCGEILLFGDI